LVETAERLDVVRLVVFLPGLTLLVPLARKVKLLIA
jgi:hypothetical protein